MTWKKLLVNDLLLLIAWVCAGKWIGHNYKKNLTERADAAKMEILESFITSQMKSYEHLNGKKASTIIFGPGTVKSVGRTAIKELAARYGVLAMDQNGQAL